MPVRLIQGDCLDVLPTLADNSVDSVITDPPYGLSDQDTADVMDCLRAWLAGERYNHNKKGFMLHSWDGWVPGPEVWKECFRVLRPGGHMLIFAGTRTYDLMVMAIRLAGFEIRDQLCWLNSQGMPHGLDVSKAIDKAAGVDRKVIGVKTNTYDGAVRDPSKHGNPADQSNIGKWGLTKTPHGMPLTEPATEEAKHWQGWNTTLKGSSEPIVLARKPLKPLTCFEFVIDNKVIEECQSLKTVSFAVQSSKRFLVHCEKDKEYVVVASVAIGSEGEKGIIVQIGEEVSLHVLTGMLLSMLEDANIDLSTILSLKDSSVDHWKNMSKFIIETESETIIDQKIWNLLHDLHTSSITMQQHMMIPNGWSCPAITVKTFSKESSAKLENIAIISALGHVTWNMFVPPRCENNFRPSMEPIVLCRKPLEGSVVENVLKHGVGAINIDDCRIPVDLSVDDPRLGGQGSWGTAKAAKLVYQGGYAGERVGSSPLGRYPSGVIWDGSDEVREVFDSFGEKASGVPGKRRKAHQTHSMSGTLDMLDRDEVGYADTGSVSRFFKACEFSEEERRIFYCGKVKPKERGNSKHPTLKPLALLNYLCRLICPKGGTILDPFAGTGTTGEASTLNGFNAILIEREAEYIKDCQNRLALFLED